MTTFEKILQCKAPEELFGDDLTQIKAKYRKYALQVHPDRVAKNFKTQAEAAFNRLNDLYKEAEDRQAAGIYGSKTPTPSKKPASTPAAPVTITFGKKKYTISEILYAGDVCDLYDCSGNALLKVARNSRDNDLVQAEAAALKGLRSDKNPHAEKYLLQIPILLDSFAFNTKGVRRHANVISKLDGEYYSLASVMERFPDGIDYRDAVWMIRRILMVLGYAHAHNIVHNAVTPEHILIRPKDHGGMLLDWCYSTIGGGKQPVAIEKYREYYPPEVIEKKMTWPGVDLYMLAKCAIKLLGKTDVPRQFQGLLKGCLLGRAYRTNDAFALHEQFSEVMRKLVGKPAFRNFEL